MTEIQEIQISDFEKSKDYYFSKDYNKSLLYIIKYLKLYPNNFEALLFKGK